MNCPLCNFPDFYQGIVHVECGNRECKHFTERALELHLEAERERRGNREDTQPMIQNPNPWKLFVGTRVVFDWWMPVYGKTRKVGVVRDLGETLAKVECDDGTWLVTRQTELRPEVVIPVPLGHMPLAT